MTRTTLKFAGIDPLLFRDGRPFSNSDGALTARTLPLPLPGTVAGFIRTMYGNQQQNWSWTKAEADAVLAISIHGPLVLRNERPVFPAPADAVLYEAAQKADIAGGAADKIPIHVMKLRPWLTLPEGAGSSLPHPNLKPLRVTKEVKPVSGNRFWSRTLMERWLTDSVNDSEVIDRAQFYTGLPVDERVHVAIDSDLGAGLEGMLFTVHRLGFEERAAHLGALVQHKKDVPESVEWSLLATADTEIPGGYGTLGGERGVASVDAENAQNGFTCSASLKKALDGAKYLRMVLATPAIFADGWKPGWLDENLEGAPPEAADLKLKLVAATVGRREAVSGWDLNTGRPKAVRWMAPAGSVYFFEVLGSSAQAFPLNECWLQPVSDGKQNQRDGYGLALWGVWAPDNNDVETSTKG